MMFWSGLLWEADASRVIVVMGSLSTFNSDDQ